MTPLAQATLAADAAYAEFLKADTAARTARPYDAHTGYTIAARTAYARATAAASAAHAAGVKKFKIMRELSQPSFNANVEAVGR